MSTTVEMRPYEAPNWFTQSGVAMKRRLIEKKGLPPFKQCLFITLTIDQIAGGRQETYEKGKDRIRRFLAKFRETIRKSFPWAWKLEFQDNGYAHWHLVIHYKKRIPRDCLSWLSDWWGMGRVNVERLRYKTFRYLFKYVSKGAFSESSDEGINLPDWFLDMKGSSRLRFWQTGGGFYMSDPDWSVKENDENHTPEQEEYLEAQKAAFADRNPDLVKPKRPKKRFSYIKYTVRQVWRMWRSNVRVFVRKDDIIRHSTTFMLSNDYTSFFQYGVQLTIRGKAVLSGEYIQTSINRLKGKIKSWQNKKYQMFHSTVLTAMA